MNLRLSPIAVLANVLVFAAFFLSLSIANTTKVTAGHLLMQQKDTTIKNRTSQPVKELQPLPVNPFAKIDDHARNCPRTAETSIEMLAAYLEKAAKTDQEKARVIFIWLTKNVRYDDYGFNTGKYSDPSAENVLKSRKAVCEGYANLFYALGKKMGLQIQKVSGYAKGYGYKGGDHFKKINHAWNIIKTDSSWRVFDATWGASKANTVNGKLVTKKEFDDFWFNTDPYAAIFTHFPEDKSYLNITPEIGLSEYEQFPYVESAFFKLGFNCLQAYKISLKNTSQKYPGCYALNTHVQLIKAPDTFELQMDTIYEFEIYIPRAMEVALIDPKNNYTYFEVEKGTFRLSYKPVKSGKHSVAVKYENGGKSFNYILMYKAGSGKKS
jgi:hypothetical protein